MRLKGSGNDYRWFLDKGAPRFNEGRFIGFIGTSLDIHDRKATEQELDGRVRQRTLELDQQNRLIQKQNDLIKKILESSLDHIAIYDRETRVLMINQSSLDLLGVTEEEILGKKITDIVPAMTGGKGHQDLLKALDGQTIHNKIYYSPVTGRYYENFIAPLEDNNDRVYAALVISHDISDLVHTTEQLKQQNGELAISKELLQQKNLELQASVDQLKDQELKDEQKNNFIAMASHELKTPITSIKGYVQLLLDAFSKGNEEKGLPPLLVRSSLVSVDKQVARLTRLIAELLDLSKIETGTLELKKERFSLNELAIETVEDILYTNPAHAINLYHDHHAYVLADKDRIGQVMINFLTNAIKYSREGSRIEVTVHRLRGGDIAFSVKDEGIGIAQDDQEKIFERFYRAGGREEQTYPGFGIGLFIAHEFIQKHGGNMFVKSEKGKGSVFTFSLPINTDP
jgi:PAS domain S-box-containing protein